MIYIISYIWYYLNGHPNNKTKHIFLLSPMGSSHTDHFNQIWCFWNASLWDIGCFLSAFEIGSISLIVLKSLRNGIQKTHQQLLFLYFWIIHQRFCQQFSLEQRNAQMKTADSEICGLSQNWIINIGKTLCCWLSQMYFSVLWAAQTKFHIFPLSCGSGSFRG